MQTNGHDNVLSSKVLEKTAKEEQAEISQPSLPSIKVEGEKEENQSNALTLLGSITSAASTKKRKAKKQPDGDNDEKKKAKLYQEKVCLTLA